MAIQPNRFNDPALGQAFSNLASIFAPPSAQDLVGYATANAKKQEAERLAWLFENANDPLADRKATMAGVYAPTQSYYAVDQNTATTRRGQDVAADTALKTNLLDNQRATITTLFGNMAPGDVGNAVPAELTAPLNLPAIPERRGAPKPLSETEQKAAERQGLVDSGMLSEQMLLDLILGERTPVQVVGPTGAPVFMTPGAAASTGAEAYVQTGSEAAPDVQNYRTPDGRSGTAVFTRDKGFVDTQTNEPLPPGSQTFKASTTGGTDQALGTNSNLTLGQRTVALADYADQRAAQYEKFLATNPGVAGMPGVITGFAQDVQAGIRELVATYGDNGVPLEVVTGLTERVTQGNGYNPAIREALNRAAELAYIQAQLGDPGGEVNVKEWERLYGQFIGNIGGNAAVAGPLRAFREQAAARRIFGQNLINGNQTAYPDMPLPGSGATPPPAGLTPDDLRYLETP